MNEGGFKDIYSKLKVLEFNQNKILTRLEWLESAQDEKSEPESLPIGHSLSKEQISDKLLFNKQREIEELKKIVSDKQKVLEDVMDQRDRYLKSNFDLGRQIKELEKTNYHQHGIITDYKNDYKNEIKQWESKKSELETANKYWEDLCQKLQLENSDLRWRFDNPALVEQQAARECVEIVTRIKNEPLTTVSTHREWMVAICEDIEKEIKKEFNLK